MAAGRITEESGTDHGFQGKLRRKRKPWSVPDFHSPMKKLARSAIVEHSAAEMYALVEQIEAYPSFLPWCTAAEVHSRQGDVTEATLTVGVGALTQSFTTRNTNRPGEAIDLKLVKG